jgi:hypothetical protein
MADYEIDVYAADADAPHAIRWFCRDDNDRAVEYLASMAEGFPAPIRLELVDAEGEVVKQCQGTAS